ncbi:unnamed protein product [Symbiodinium sp. CCMP2592]|nr:unnamed protein product [Symbiodinium sp. CCMP2592]
MGWDNGCEQLDPCVMQIAFPPVSKDKGLSWNSSWAYFIEPFPPNTTNFRLTHSLWWRGATETSDVHLAHSLSQQSPPTPSLSSDETALYKYLKMQSRACNTSGILLHHTFLFAAANLCTFASRIAEKGTWRPEISGTI